MQPIFAYLDAGSGSMLLQLLVGGVASCGVICRLYWRSLADLVRRLQKPQASSTLPAEPSSSAS